MGVRSLGSEFFPLNSSLFLIRSKVSSTSNILGVNEDIKQRFQTDTCKPRQLNRHNVWPTRCFWKSWNSSYSKWRDFTKNMNFCFNLKKIRRYGNILNDTWLELGSGFHLQTGHWLFSLPQSPLFSNVYPTPTSTQLQHAMSAAISHQAVPLFLLHLNGRKWNISLSILKAGKHKTDPKSWMCHKKPEKVIFFTSTQKYARCLIRKHACLHWKSTA